MPLGGGTRSDSDLENSALGVAADRVRAALREAVDGVERRELLEERMRSARGGRRTLGWMESTPSELGAPPERVWEQLEVAWPASLLLGFSGAAIGLALSLTWLAALLAFASIAPLWWRLALRPDRRRSIACAAGWLIGSCGAVLGTALDGRLTNPAAVLAEFGPWNAPLSDGAGGNPEPTLHFVLSWFVVPAALFAVSIVTARPSRGLVGAAVASWAAVSATTCALNAWSAGGGRSFAAEVSSFFEALPPHCLLEFAALAVASGGLSGPGASPPKRWESRRFWLALAAGLELLALATRSLSLGLWP